MHGRVRSAHMWRVAICIGINRDCAEAEPVRSAHDAQRDLAAIGDQHRLKSSGTHDFFLPGRMSMYLQMMPSMTSSAPPPIEVRRPSRKKRDTGFSQV